VKNYFIGVQQCVEFEQTIDDQGQMELDQLNVAHHLFALSELNRHGRCTENLMHVQHLQQRDREPCDKVASASLKGESVSITCGVPFAGCSKGVATTSSLMI
jgi:hypothetical protein